MPEGEGSSSRKVRDALESAQKSVEEALKYVHKSFTSLQAEHEQLQQAYDRLKEQHKELQDKHQSDTDAWRQFKSWWKGALDRKTSTQQTPNRKSSSNGQSPSPLVPAAQHSPSSESGLKRNGKARMSETEITLLQRVGLDCTALMPGLNEKQTSATEVQVKSEEDKDEGEKGENGQPPILLKQGKGKSRAESEASKHTIKKEDNFSCPSQSPLEEIVNTSPNSLGKQRAMRDSLKRDRQRKMEELKRDPLKHKGRGRYSSDSNRAKTINDEYEVDAERNGNVSFLHKQVIRDKAERKQMHAYDCECCSDWYDAVGVAPLRRFEDPRSVVIAAAHLKADEGEIQGSSDEGQVRGEAQRQAHRQQISRHRDYGPPASTPPGFWDIGFPDTQKQQELNKLAHEEHKKKREQVAKDPRFKRRVHS